MDHDLHMQTLFDTLQRGAVFVSPTIARDGYPASNIVLQLATDARFPRERKIIRWHCFGSSATANTIDDLAWIIETIFKTTARDFMRVNVAVSIDDPFTGYWSMGVPWDEKPEICSTII